jgi:protein-L-isoaspartate(D-aspartate) O-methyltransferase
MSAAGPLAAEHPGSHPRPAAARTLADFTEEAGPRWAAPLATLAYRDLWYAAGVRSRHATHAAVPGREQSVLALLDERRTGGAVILPDGAIRAGGDQAQAYVAEARTILDEWESAGRPPMQAWQIGLALTADPATPIWVPANWRLRGPERR